MSGDVEIFSWITIKRILNLSLHLQIFNRIKFLLLVTFWRISFFFFANNLIYRKR